MKKIAYLNAPISNTKLMGFGYKTPDYIIGTMNRNSGDTLYSVNWIPDVYFYFGTLNSPSISKGAETLLNDPSKVAGSLRVGIGNNDFYPLESGVDFKL